jgi:hypothetical protein
VHKAAEIIMQENKEIIPSLIERWLGKRSEYGKV